MGFKIIINADGDIVEEKVCQATIDAITTMLNNHLTNTRIRVKFEHTQDEE